MRVISVKRISDYEVVHPSARDELRAWYAEARKASWRSPAELKRQYRHASILKSGRVVFNICGNKHRLIVWINYELGLVYIKFIGTHHDYDSINAESI
ncbi:MAG: type II toxin-antitoxin system HigB family toxin [Candidatus Kapabacteria bacterium]|nr:type II toxin-antitoxin system HigB family toxin [Candidatus Kapabacteria bacterium]